MKNKPIIVIGGEPYSVFFEIFFKTIKSKNYKKYKKPVILIASKKLLIEQMKKLHFNFKINLINKNQININQINNEKINLINVNFNFKKSFDKISVKSNSYIDESFKIGLELMKKKISTELINGPISKKHFLRKRYLGITEYLAHKTRKKNKAVMLIHNRELSVSPMTTHLPLKLVHKNLSKKKIIYHIKTINNFYKKKFQKKPKFAITGLNPHCESNYSSSEEDKIIIPTIRNLKLNKYKVDGPFAADTIFMQNNLREYDVIIGMYHDQVLTPIKTLFGFSAINITLGLPFIRISPDHGPNNKMLGKNLSDPKSLILAINFLNN